MSFLVLISSSSGIFSITLLRPIGSLVQIPADEPILLGPGAEVAGAYLCFEERRVQLAEQFPRRSGLEVTNGLEDHEMGVARPNPGGAAIAAC